MFDINLNGKTVFITGATRGIGAAIVVALKNSNAKVIGTGTQSDPNPILDGYFQADFTNLNEIYNCANYLKDIRPDILINNAGIGKNLPFTEINPTDFLLMHQVNVFAPFVSSSHTFYER